MKKSTVIYITLALIFVAVFVGLNSQYEQKEVVATVDGEKITQSELYKSMIVSNGRQALDILISQKIIDIEARKHQIIITEQEIQEKMAQYEEAYGGREALLTLLQANGITLNDLRNNIQMTLKITKLLTPDIVVSDEEIAAYFEQNKDDFARQNPDPKLEDFKDKIKDTILEQKVQIGFDSWLQERLSEYDIKTSL